MANYEFKPLRNICEYLNGVHIYADEARQGKTRTVEASHFCSHVNDRLQQCLLYNSAQPNARLTGIECMAPAEVYTKLDPDEQKLWHSHAFEVKSGMLVLPKPAKEDTDKWEAFETEALSQVIGWYGKTWHFWQVDRGDELPLGMPRLMGSVTAEDQINLDALLQGRDKRCETSWRHKRELRKGIEEPEVHPNADSWWKEAAASRSSRSD